MLPYSEPDTVRAHLVLMPILRSFYHHPNFTGKETEAPRTYTGEVIEPGFKHRWPGSRAQTPRALYVALTAPVSPG